MVGKWERATVYFLTLKNPFMTNNDPSTFIRGTSEMENLTRRMDWNVTDLGPPQRWPTELKIAVEQVYSCSLPMFVAWGAKLEVVYNDAFIGLLGTKHPKAMAQPHLEIWAEARESIEPYVKRALAGESLLIKDMSFDILRGGGLEQVWVTFFYSPLRRSDGNIVGIQCVCVETTDKANAITKHRESEQRLQILLDASSSIGTWSVELETNVTYLDAQFARLFQDDAMAAEGGTNLEQLINLIHPEDRQRVVDAVTWAIENRTPYDAEYRIPQKSGQDIWINARGKIYGSPYFDKERFAGIAVDITRKKETELALAREIKELEAAKSRQAFQVQIADRIRPLANPEEVVAVASHQLGTYLGVARVVYAEADDSGKTVRMNADWTNGELPSMAGVVLHLDDFGLFVRQDILAGKTLVIDDVTSDDRSAAYADAYAANGVCSFVAIPLIKAGRLRAILNLHDSRPHYWTEHEIALAQDMLDRTWSAMESARAQTELRSQRDHSQYIFDTMNEGFVMIDRDWTVRYINAEGLRLSDRVGQQVVGSNHWEMWSELVGSEVETLYRRVMQTQLPETMEVQYAHLDGTVFCLELRVYPSMEDGIALFCRDITSRKVAEEKLTDADRRKDDFLAMLAHELRNPLAPIGAAAELLQSVKLDEEQVRQTSQIIGRQVDHMTGLVNDLLDMSRVTRGLVELDTAPLNIGDIITDAIEQALPLIESRRHHIGTQLTDDATLVLGDKKRLVQVITNLLSNAAKYTHEGGHLLIRTKVRDAHVHIEISDDGMGMAPDLVARAFDLFAQAERTSDRSSGGLGLGLALVKSLVELHGGTVTCKSAGLGNGSTFSVCLPRLLADEGSKVAQDPDLALQKSTKALRIMIVDDNIDAAVMLAMLLEASGHEVLVEHSARRALERAKAELPLVFLLDIGLPEMDGNKLARRLRSQPENAKATLIAITGYGQENDHKNSLAAGFDYHFVKPVDIKKLFAILVQIESKHF